ncbi:hypothetical protein J6590_034231 [Homalodisca vitripennis]|nr:hypothetical protein J6590_034231 [Homalodisca vitripennis]
MCKSITTVYIWYKMSESQQCFVSTREERRLCSSGFKTYGTDISEARRRGDPGSKDVSNKVGKVGRDQLGRLDTLTNNRRPAQHRNAWLVSIDLEQQRRIEESQPRNLRLWRRVVETSIEISLGPTIFPGDYLRCPCGQGEDCLAGITSVADIHREVTDVQLRVVNLESRSQSPSHSLVLDWSDEHSRPLMRAFMDGIHLRAFFQAFLAVLPPLLRAFLAALRPLLQAFMDGVHFRVFFQAFLVVDLQGFVKDWVKFRDLTSHMKVILTSLESVTHPGAVCLYPPGPGNVAPTPGLLACVYPPPPPAPKFCGADCVDVVTPHTVVTTDSCCCAAPPGDHSLATITGSIKIVDLE